MKKMQAKNSSMLKDYNQIEMENKIFSAEIIELKSQLEEMSLSNKVKDLALETIKNNNEPQVSIFKSPSNKGRTDSINLRKCDSWWCPKHSNLLTISKQLDIKTAKDKDEIDKAMKRQKYWISQGQIRCCVIDRKTGVDKHTEPPNCWIQFKNGLNLSEDFSKILKITSDCIISSDEEI